jgi:hypothetical protein
VKRRKPGGEVVLATVAAHPLSRNQFVMILVGMLKFKLCIFEKKMEKNWLLLNKMVLYISKDKIQVQEGEISVTYDRK